MFGKKEEKSVVTTKNIDMHPISHVADSILKYQKQLAQREVESLDEMSAVQTVFEEALQENVKLKEQMDSLSEVFADVGQIAARFDDVKNQIVESVGDAQGKVDELKSSSLAVQNSFGEIQSAFAAVQTSVQQEIGQVAQSSEGKLAHVKTCFNSEEERLQRVLTHIERANDLGTTKSSMFEDMNNLVSQLKPMAEEMQKNQ